jgi:4'-phosphopantetheinyl transferase EntD
MPLFFEQEVDGDTRLAVWHITEEEAFFDVPLQRSITHPHKRLQHLAGRYLLRHLFPEFPLELILIADTRKPYLQDEAFHFSVSHAGDHAAAVVSRVRRVGIDIEQVSQKVERIRHKFLSAEEEARVSGQKEHCRPEQLSTLIWSVKEAAFKWYGKGGVDFRADMPISRLEPAGDTAFHTELLFQMEVQQAITARSNVWNDLVLSTVIA